MHEARVLMDLGAGLAHISPGDRITSIFNPLLESYFGRSFESDGSVLVNIKRTAYVTLRA